MPYREQINVSKAVCGSCKPNMGVHTKGYTFFVKY